MASGSTFTSVKLAAALVDDARAAALTMRRSVASQIEYWATLGRSLESAGLTTRDTGALIARQDAAVYAVRSAASNKPVKAARPKAAKEDPAADSVADAIELAALKTHVVALAKSGALARRASEVVAANAARAARPASKPRASRAN